jgi:hypothetical protein
MVTKEKEYIVKSEAIRTSLRQLCKTSCELFLNEYKSGRILQKSRFDRTPVSLSEKGVIVDKIDSYPDYASFITPLGKIVRESPEAKIFEESLRNDEKARRHLEHNTAILNTSKPDTVQEYIWKFVGWLVVECNGFAFSNDVFDRLYPTFEEYLYSDEIPYIAFAAIWHLNMEASEIIFNDDVRLSRVADSQIQEYLVKDTILFVPIPIEPRYQYVLELSGTTPKLFAKYPNKIRFSGTRNIEQEIERVLSAMRVFKLGDIKLTHLGIIPLGWTYEQRQGISSRIGDPPRFNLMYHLTDEDIPKLVEFYRKFESLPNTGPIKSALSSFDSSFYRDRFEDRLVDCVTSFEALLLEEETELQFRLALRVAALLGNSSDEREMLFNQTKKAYRIRSAIVHGADSQRVVKELKGVKIHNFVFQFQETLRRALRRYCVLYNINKEKGMIIRDLDDLIIKGSGNLSYGTENEFQSSNKENVRIRK